MKKGILSLIFVISILLCVGCKEEHVHNYIREFNNTHHQDVCECGDVINREKHENFVVINDEYHWAACECGYESDKSNHIVETKYDDEYHWDTCVCGYIGEKKEHDLTFENGKTKHWQVCGCGYSTELVLHNFESYEKNDEYHWGICECGMEGDPVRHSSTKRYDEVAHWYECACGRVTSYAEHTLTEWYSKPTSYIEAGYQRRNCTNCNYVENIEIPKLEYTGANSVSETINSAEDGERVTFVGVVAGYSYCGNNTTAGRERAGLIIMDNEKAVSIMLNGCQIFGGILSTYADSTGNTLFIGAEVLVSGIFNSTSPGVGEAPEQVGRYYIDCYNDASIYLLDYHSHNIPNEPSVIIESNSDLQNFADNLEFGTIVKFIGTLANPIYLGGSSSSTPFKIKIFMNNAVDNSGTKYNGQTFVFDSLGNTFNTGNDKWYKELLGIDKPFVGPNDTTEAIPYYGEIYGIVTFHTGTYYQMAVINTKEWIEYDSTVDIEPLVQDIINYNSVITEDLSDIYAYYGGTGVHNIENYIPDFNPIYADLVELQFGHVVYVGDSDVVIDRLTDNFLRISRSYRDMNDITLSDAYIELANLLYYQGNQIQYDQNTTYDRKIYDIRPEDPTVDREMYLDCSSFVNNAFYNAFGQVLLDGYDMNKIKTKSLTNFAKNNPNSNEVVYYYEVKGNESSVEREAIINEFKSLLQPGDIYVYRHGPSMSSESGHAMLYIGNGVVLHSTGSSYNYTSNTEKYENSGTVLLESTNNTIYSTTSKRHLFYINSSGSDKTTRFAILRPINKENLEITKETYFRCLNKGLLIEKTCSKEYLTNTGSDYIKYFITIKNESNKALRNISVVDYLGENFVYKDGSVNFGGNVKGQEVLWNIKELGRGDEIVLEYMGKFSNLPKGTLVGECGYVANIRTNKPLNIIGEDNNNIALYSILNEYCNNTNVSFSENADNSLMSPLENKVEIANDLALFNIIYKRVYQQMSSSFTAFDELSKIDPKTALDEMLEITSNKVNFDSDSDLVKIMIPGGYGGKLFKHDMSDERIRLLHYYYLEEGDIILYANGDSYGAIMYYELYTKDGWYAGRSLLSVTNGEISTISDLDKIKKQLTAFTGYDYYVVLRPDLY